ncbi:MAG: CHC2 zinc finger domain-containing protein [Planctomycetota bacterium]
MGPMTHWPDKTLILKRLDFRSFYQAHLPSLKSNGKPEATACCPFHEDKSPSFSVNLENGLWNCFAGCGGGDVFEFYMRHKKVDFPAALREIAASQGIMADSLVPRVVATYEYRDAEDRSCYIKERIEPGRDGRAKEFFFRHPDGGRMVLGRGGDPVPYNLPELLAASCVIVVEGERKADILKGWGLAGTCLDSGARSPWRPEYLPHFAGKSVVILPDNDGPGRGYAAGIARALHGHVGEIKVVELPGLPEAGDIVDWVNDPANTKERLNELIQNAPIWNPETSRIEPSTKSETDSWPVPLADEAFHGLAGEFVRRIEEQTEAAPAALLIQFLTAFGNIIGRSAHFWVEATRHALTLFVVLVGATAKARKGTAADRVLALCKPLDDVWAARIQGGLSSGEGLIWAVRDEIIKKEPVREKKRIVGYEDVITDPGIEDKRLLAFAPELAGLLRAMSREGNTLSAVLRAAWDGGDLRIMTKNSPVKATGAHIAVVAHITTDELRRELTRIEAGNGFGNRFLWCCVRRPRLLPEGGRFDLNDFLDFSTRLAQAVTFARTVGEMRRDDAARELWIAEYPRLSREIPGLLGAVTARAEAQTMRLACLFALLDKSDTVRLEHLWAALAVWRYCEDSARHIWKDSVGDPVSDEILRALQNSPDGLTRSQINNLFSGHVKTGRLSGALSTLAGAGRIVAETHETEGRSVEIWRIKGRDCV